MAESTSGQDEANPTFWLATQVLHWSHYEKFTFWPYIKSFTDQACMVKMAE